MQQFCPDEIDLKETIATLRADLKEANEDRERLRREWAESRAREGEQVGAFMKLQRENERLREAMELIASGMRGKGQDKPHGSPFSHAREALAAAAEDAPPIGHQHFAAGDESKPIPCSLCGPHFIGKCPHNLSQPPAESKERDDGR